MNLRMFGGFVAAGLATTTVTFGQNLLDSNPLRPTYNNPSFESPDVAAVGLGAAKWTADGPTIDPGLGFPILAGCGVFENVPDDPDTPGSDGHLENIDGTQAAYLFARSFPDFSTGQVKDHSFTQVTQILAQAGAQYQLSVGVANAGAAPPPESTLTISFFALDGSTEIPLASTAIKNDGVTSPGLNGLAFFDFFATSGPIAGAAVGKPIGIRLQTHTTPQNPSITGQFDLDDVQLTIVPEPAGLALLAGAAGVLGSRCGRRRR